MRWRLAKICLLTLVAVIVTDAVLGQVGRRIVSTWRSELQEMAARPAHPIFHHGLKPSVAFESQFGSTRTSYVTNSLAFRDASVRDVPLRSEKRRLLFVGDSMTEGLGVTYDESFVGKIGESLRERNAEVLNAGLISYAGSIYYRKVRHYLETVGLHVDAVIVFMDVSDMEDEALCYHMGSDEVVHSLCPRKISFSRKAKTFLRMNSAYYRFYRATKDGLSEWSRRQKLGPIGAVTNLDRARWTLEDGLYEKIGRPGLEKNAQYLDKLHAFLAERGIPLTVAVYPWPDQILARDLESKQVTFWRAWARARRAGFVNLFPTFINEKDPVSVITDYFIPYDVHFNAAGHARVAEAFLNQYRLPPPR